MRLQSYELRWKQFRKAFHFSSPFGCLSHSEFSHNFNQWRYRRTDHYAITGKRIPLPDAVARIYEATAELERNYPERKFTPDGHLVGSIGEVIVAEALGLTLHPMSRPGHDAFDAQGEVQI